MVLELTTKYHGVSRREIDVVVDALLEFGDQPAHVASFDVGLNNHLALNVVTTDLRWAGLDPHLGHIAKPHPGPIGRLQNQGSNRIDTVTVLFL